MHRLRFGHVVPVGVPTSKRMTFKAAKSPTKDVTLKDCSLNVEAGYRTLVKQIHAVVFMAYLDKGIGEAHVSPQIETMLGYTAEE